MDHSHPDKLDFHSFPTIAYDKLERKAVRLKQILLAAGIRIPSNSRISNYQKVISDFCLLVSKQKPVKPIKMKRYYQALYEVQQLTAIAEQLTNASEIPDWRSRLKQLVSGHDLPENDGSRSPARDFQFELFVAAVFRRSGYKIELEEPDIVVKTSEYNIGIAAKRPKSIRTLEGHIRKGNKQIISSHLGGIIALDISLLNNISNKIIAVDRKENSVDPVIEIADYFVRHNAGRIRSLVNPQHVFGILICMSSLCFVRYGPQIGMSTRWTIANFVNSPDWRYELLRTFVKKLSKGLAS